MTEGHSPYKLNPNGTVFIVGAGASKPYGLPTGVELKNAIVENPTMPGATAQRNSIARDRLFELNREYADRLKRCGLASIDAWLSHNTSDTQLLRWGKYNIASKLISLELNAVQKGLLAGDWLQWLYQQLFSDRSKWPKSPLKFVTFNYDRLIKLAFFTMFKNTLSCSPAQAWNLTEQHVSVHHVHGSLNDHNVLNAAEKNGIGCKFDEESMAKISSGIRVVHEERNNDDDDDVIDFRQSIQDASTLVFLGFGFDTANLRRIGLTDRPFNAKLVLASCKGSTRAERESWYEQLPKRPCYHNDDENRSCLDFMRTHLYFEGSPKPSKRRP